jgi:hypothetical protein
VTPVPESAMESGELVALLATEILPVTAPAEAGVKVAVKVAVCPGFSITPETPVALKPAPETVAPEIVTRELPALVSVTVCVPLLGMVTLPKLKEDALEFRRSDEAPTVSIAALLVALPAPLLTTAVNFALLSVDVSAGVVYVGEVAPLIGAPFLLHWYVSGAVPVAATVNEAVFPAITVWLAGCVVMAGATVVLVTVSTAALLVALPAVLLTSAVNCALLSAVVSAGVVNVEEVAPLIAAPFFFHRYVIGAVPVAATLKVAVCPTTIFALAGCEEIVGATGPVVELVPVPLRAIEFVEPLDLLNSREPE